MNLQFVTDEILEIMKKPGNWFNPESHSEPCAWDINLGWCEEWAERAKGLVGGEVYWLDQLNEEWSGIYFHAVLVLDGKYYDSQHPEGVNNLKELDLVRGVTREEFLLKSA